MNRKLIEVRVGEKRYSYFVLFDKSAYKVKHEALDYFRKDTQYTRKSKKIDKYYGV